MEKRRGYLAGQEVDTPGQSEVLDEEEQDAIIESLESANRTSSIFYRHVLSGALAALVFTYTAFFVSVVVQKEDVLLVPSNQPAHSSLSRLGQLGLALAEICAMTLSLLQLTGLVHVEMSWSRCNTLVPTRSVPLEPILFVLIALAFRRMETAWEVAFWLAPVLTLSMLRLGMFWTDGIETELEGLKQAKFHAKGA